MEVASIHFVVATLHMASRLRLVGLLWDVLGVYCLESSFSGRFVWGRVGTGCGSGCGIPDKISQYMNRVYKACLDCRT